MTGKITDHFRWSEALKQQELHDPAITPDIVMTAYLLEVLRWRVNTRLNELGRAATPMIVNSWYRRPDHAVEKNKEHGPGAHSTGKAVDIRVVGSVQAGLILKYAGGLGFEGFGPDPKKGHFIHLDWWDGTSRSPRPGCWGY